MEPKNWWLISDDDVQKIRRDLELFASFPQDIGGRIASGTLHTLDAGLHATDAVPGDWKEDADEAGS